MNNNAFKEMARLEMRTLAEFLRTWEGQSDVCIIAVAVPSKVTRPDAVLTMSSLPYGIHEGSAEDLFNGIEIATIRLQEAIKRG